jgi:hypothetical protein
MRQNLALSTRQLTMTYILLVVFYNVLARGTLEVLLDWPTPGFWQSWLGNALQAYIFCIPA